jgi:transcriptional regulator with XRE-family HTH domain
MTKISQRRAAERIGISPSTLSAYCRRGIAPTHVTLLGVRCFDVDALDAWLATRTFSEGA